MRGNRSKPFGVPIELAVGSLFHKRQRARQNASAGPWPSPVFSPCPQTGAPWVCYRGVRSAGPCRPQSVLNQSTLHCSEEGVGKHFLPHYPLGFLTASSAALGSKPQTLTRGNWICWKDVSSKNERSSGDRAEQTLEHLWGPQIKRTLLLAAWLPFLGWVTSHGLSLWFKTAGVSHPLPPPPHWNLGERVTGTWTSPSAPVTRMGIQQEDFLEWDSRWPLKDELDFKRQNKVLRGG